MTAAKRPAPKRHVVPIAKRKTRGERVIAFIERYCKVPEGKLVGKLMVLDPFQRKFILEVYDNPHKTRRAYLSIARKNGKTALIAAIVLAHVCGPEAVLNSQVISGARSRDQAALVFKLAAKMIRLSSELSTLVRIIPSTKTLMGLARNVEYRAISAEGKTAHGLSPILAILDEVGQVRGSHDDFIEAIETAQGAHDDPLLIAISTQAPNDADLFSIWLDDAAKGDDPQIVSHVYTTPLDTPLTDPAGWLLSNPALGNFRSEQDVEKQAARAMRMPSFESSFRNLTLNQRVVATMPFVTRSVWMACAQQPDMEAFKRFDVVAGLDLSSRTDLTCLALICFDGTRYHVLPFFWTPAEGLEDRAKRDRAPYDVWVKQGFIRTTPGKSIDYEHVVADFMALTEGMNITVIGFDRWRIDVIRKEFDRIGVQLPLEPFGQGFKDMGPALDEFETALLNGLVNHGAHPVLTMCAANVVVERDPADNRKFTKAKSTGRIDGMVAAAMAFGMYAKTVEEQDHDQAVYDLNPA